MNDATRKRLEEAGWYLAETDRGDFLIENGPAELGLMPFHEEAQRLNIYVTPRSGAWPAFTREQLTALRAFIEAFEQEGKE